MTAPLLSIVVTAHNCEAWIEQTLTSIDQALSGDWQQCELLAINDASDDGTGRLLDEAQTRFPAMRVVDTALRNIGKVRNCAVGEARGEYVLMVDGDDRLLPGSMGHWLAQLGQQQPDILLTRLIEVRDSTTLPAWQPLPASALPQDEAITRFLIHRDFQAHFIGQFFRRTLLQAHPFPDFICYEDAWLFPVMLKHSRKTLWSRAGMYLYFKRSNSLSSALTAEKVRCLLQATQQMDRVLPAKFSLLITCHWLDIANRYQALLREMGEWTTVAQRIRSVSPVRFLASGKIRLSYKRKLLKFHAKA